MIVQCSQSFHLKLIVHVIQMRFKLRNGFKLTHFMRLQPGITLPSQQSRNSEVHVPLIDDFVCGLSIYPDHTNDNESDMIEHMKTLEAQPQVRIDNQMRSRVEADVRCPVL